MPQPYPSSRAFGRQAHRRGRNDSAIIERMNLRSIRRRFVVALLPFAVACGSSIRTAGPAVRPLSPAPQASASTPAPQPARPVVEDPVLKLLADSDQHFKAGQGHLEL